MMYKSCPAEKKQKSESKILSNQPLTCGKGSAPTIQRFYLSNVIKGTPPVITIGDGTIISHLLTLGDKCFWRQLDTYDRFQLMSELKSRSAGWYKLTDGSNSIAIRIFQSDLEDMQNDWYVNGLDILLSGRERLQYNGCKKSSNQINIHDYWIDLGKAPAYTAYLNNTSYTITVHAHYDPYSGAFLCLHYKIESTDHRISYIRITSEADIRLALGTGLEQKIRKRVCNTEKAQLESSSLRQAEINERLLKLYKLD